MDKNQAQLIADKVNLKLDELSLPLSSFYRDVLEKVKSEAEKGLYSTIISISKLSLLEIDSIVYILEKKGFHSECRGIEHLYINWMSK